MGPVMDFPVEADQIIGLYNGTFRASVAHMADFAGMHFYAFQSGDLYSNFEDNEFVLRRYVNRRSDKIIWQISMKFRRTAFGAATIVYRNPRNLHLNREKLEVFSGVATVVAFSGDVEVFQKDWVIAKLHDHEWNED